MKKYLIILVLALVIGCAKKAETEVTIDSTGAYVTVDSVATDSLVVDSLK